MVARRLLGPGAGIRSGTRQYDGHMSASTPQRSDGGRFDKAVLPQLDAAYNLARWLTRNSTDAEDVVQDACERALKYFGAFHGDDAKAWFLTIVRHACYDWLKRNRPAELVPGDGQAIDEAPDLSAPTPEQVVMRNASAAALTEAIGALPLGYREVLILRELEEMPYREIARVVDIPIGTVMSRLARARGLLQRSPVLRSIRDRAAL
jgi:RNA polymerase sigma-70 factor, ECF subfamily